MNLMNHLIRWGWLLGVALLAPVALPAGGGERGCTEILCRSKTSPYITYDECFLMASPSLGAPALRKIEFSTPLEILRIWETRDNRKWAQIKLASFEGLQNNYLPRNGWIKISSDSVV